MAATRSGSFKTRAFGAFSPLENQVVGIQAGDLDKDFTIANAIAVDVESDDNGAAIVLDDRLACSPGECPD
ncbi:MAG: hypothetical protein ACKVH0_09600 [Alphaproteobacteria bacterium]|jgi:hypothetical protein